MKPAFIFFVFIFTSLFHCGAQDVSHTWTWDSLEKDLAGLELNDLSYQSFQKSALFLAVSTNKNRPLFLEMAVQRQHPLVALGGFFCLKKFFPEATLLPTMEIILRAENPGLPIFAPVYDYLQDKHETNEFQRTLTDVSVVPPPDIDSYLVLIQLLRYDALYDWFNKPQRAPLSGACEAAILDRLYGEPEKQARPVTVLMSNELKMLKTIPGLPRAVYLMYTPDEKGDEFLNALRSVVEDETLNDAIVGAVIHKRMDLVRALPLDTLKISDKRRGLLRKILDR